MCFLRIILFQTVLSYFFSGFWLLRRNIHHYDIKLDSLLVMPLFKNKQRETPSLESTDPIIRSPRSSPMPTKMSPQPPKNPSSHPHKSATKHQPNGVHKHSPQVGTNLALGFFAVGQFAVRKKSEPNLTWPNLTETSIFSYGEQSHGKVSHGEKSVGHFSP